MSNQTYSMSAVDLAWARQHDWGRDAYLLDTPSGVIIAGCVERTVTPGGVLIDRPTAFGTVRTMRRWAGY